MRAAKAPVRLLERVKIVFAASQGKTNDCIARELKCSKVRVGKWRSRFARFRMPGIEKDAERSGRLAKVRLANAEEIIRKTTQETPKDHTHWSTRVLAKELGDPIAFQWTAKADKIIEKVARAKAALSK